MHPAKNFITYLFTTNAPDTDSNDWVRGVLTEFGLFRKQATDAVLD